MAPYMEQKPQRKGCKTLLCHGCSNVVAFAVFQLQRDCAIARRPSIGLSIFGHRVVTCFGGRTTRTRHAKLFFCPRCQTNSVVSSNLDQQRKGTRSQRIERIEGVDTTRPTRPTRAWCHLCGRFYDHLTAVPAPPFAQVAQLDPLAIQCLQRATIVHGTGPCGLCPSNTHLLGK